MFYIFTMNFIKIIIELTKIPLGTLGKVPLVNKSQSELSST